MVSNSGETIRSVTRAVVERAAAQARPPSAAPAPRAGRSPLGVRDDAVAQRLAAVAAQHLRRGLEDRQLACGVARCTLGARALDDAQRPRVVEERRAAGAPRALRRAPSSRARCARPRAARRRPPRACRSSGAGRPSRGESRTPAPRGSAAPGAADQRLGVVRDAARPRSMRRSARKLAGRRHTGRCGATAWRSASVPVSTCSVAARRA